MTSRYAAVRMSPSAPASHCLSASTICSSHEPSAGLADAPPDAPPARIRARRALGVTTCTGGLSCSRAARAATLACRAATPRSRRPPRSARSQPPGLQAELQPQGVCGPPKRPASTRRATTPSNTPSTPWREPLSRRPAAGEAGWPPAEMQRRCSGDTAEMPWRCRGDTAEAADHLHPRAHVRGRAVRQREMR